MGEKNTINYNGHELETITEGYWPDGITLVGSDGCAHIFPERKVFYLRDGHAIFDGKENGTCWTKLSCWAIVPPKPSPRRLTNREVSYVKRDGEVREYKMKINYKGQELETITEGYWPEGATLVFADDFKNIGEMQKVVCIRNGFAFRNDGSHSARWKYWAILPPKPAKRRLTNREAFDLCNKHGWVCLYSDGYVMRDFGYTNGTENEPLRDFVKSLRAQDSDEWLDPTTDLLEAGK